MIATLAKTFRSKIVSLKTPLCNKKSFSYCTALTFTFMVYANFALKIRANSHREPKKKRTKPTFFKHFKKGDDQKFEQCEVKKLNPAKQHLQTQILEAKPPAFSFKELETRETSPVYDLPPYEKLRGGPQNKHHRQLNFESTGVFNDPRRLAKHFLRHRARSFEKSQARGREIVAKACSKEKRRSRSNSNSNKRRNEVVVTGG